MFERLCQRLLVARIELDVIGGFAGSGTDVPSNTEMREGKCGAGEAKEGLGSGLEYDAGTSYRFRSTLGEHKELEN